MKPWWTGGLQKVFLRESQSSVKKQPSEDSPHTSLYMALWWPWAGNHDISQGPKPLPGGHGDRLGGPSVRLLPILWGSL